MMLLKYVWSFEFVVLLLALGLSLSRSYTHAVSEQGHNMSQYTACVKYMHYTNTHRHV